LQEAQALDAASNAVVDLVHAGRLDEAEHAARELLVRYPEVHDGYDRLGMVHEARGQFREAADCYRRVIEFARASPEDYDTAFVDSFNELIAQLEASRDRSTTCGQRRRRVRLTKAPLANSRFNLPQPGGPPAAWQGPA
jgi:tetratricopeptide (TPR) repeat protein